MGRAKSRERSELCKEHRAMNLFNGDEDLQRRYADALKTSVDKTFGVEMNNEPVAWMVEVENDTEFSFNKEWAEQLAKRHKGKIIPLYTHPSGRIAELEQQLKEEIQARADALDDLNNRMLKFMKSYNEMAWKLEEVGGAYTHPVKELTELDYAEFLPIWKDFIKDAGSVLNVQMVAHHFYNLALRKAQEK